MQRKEYPGWLFLGGLFCSGGWKVSRGPEQTWTTDCSRYEQSWRFNLVQPDRTCRRVTAWDHQHRPDSQTNSQPTCKSSEWAPPVGTGAGAKCGEKESSHADPAATQSRFGSRFEYVWPSSAAPIPSRVLATGRPSRPRALMAFRNRPSLKEGSFWGGLLCRSATPAYLYQQPTHIHIHTPTAERKNSLLCAH